MQGYLEGLRLWQNQQVDAEMPPVPASSAEPAEPAAAPTFYDGDEFACSICTNGLEEGERVVRLRCRHCFHAGCWNEASTHIEFCPNCRAPAEMQAVWNFIGPRPDASQGQPNLMGSDPANEHQLITPRSVHTEHEFATPQHEFATPRDHMQPTFPTFYDVQDDTSGLQLGQDAPGGTRSGEARYDAALGRPGVPPSLLPRREVTGTSTQSFLNQTALASGKHALLVDVGSYGNLAGQGWVRDAAKIGRSHNKRPTMQARAKTLHVSGVGEGAQECTHDCTVPIAMTTIDGRTIAGTYTTPTVNEGPNSNGIPGLLGLRALQEKRAILDFSKGPDDMRITFPGPGDVSIELSPGSDTFKLESAPSGHLMLPCCEHEAMWKAARAMQDREEEITLINRGPPPEPGRARVEPGASSSSSSSQGPADPGMHLGMLASTGYASPSDFPFKAPPGLPPPQMAPAVCTNTGDRSVEGVTSQGEVLPPLVD